MTDIAIGPVFAGRGYGRQILQALVKLALEEREAAELHYDCFKENTISRRLAESCGFMYDHSEQAELLKNGEPVILAYYKMEK